MDLSKEIELRGLLFGGILVTLLLAISIIIFFVVYQRKLLAQQINLQWIRDDYQRQLLTASIEAQEKERNRIAQDLHDEVGSSLSTAKLFVNQLALNSQDSEKTQLIENVKGILTNTIQNIRSVSQNLMPAELNKFGLEDTLQNLVDLISEASPQLEIDFKMQLLASLSFQQALALYRIIQESINNTLKHAQATHLQIHLWQEDSLVKLLMQDNGKGMDLDESAGIIVNKPGIGLKSIEARVTMLQGLMKIHSAKEAGVRVEIEIDLKHA